MAFSTSNLSRDTVGSSYALKGTWTGLDSDTANGTVTGPGYCSDATFKTNNTVGPENDTSVRITNSNGTWTVSVYYNSTVTAGTFQIAFK